MPPGKTKIIIAFDLYGTILSTDSVTDALAARFGPAPARQIAARWRQYQLEYTWRITSMGAYEPFDRVTRAALRHAVAEQQQQQGQQQGQGPGAAGDAVPDRVADELMRSYDSLAVFPDVPPALEALQRRAGGRKDGGGGAEDVEVEALVFSNGTEEMLRASLDTSPDLRPFRGGPGLLRRLVTVDAARTYKPSPQSYGHLQAEADGRGEALVWLVSANPFDVVGARAAGLRAAWIDRAGTGWVDRLGDVIFGGGDDVQKRRAQPTVIAKGVDEAVEEILKLGI